MNSINTLIVEDDEAQALLIKNYIERTGILNYIGICTCINCLDEIMKVEKIDLLFLDVMIDGENSIELLKSKNINSSIIITSNFDYALQSFDLNGVVDYLMKPIKYESFLQAVTKVTTKTVLEPINTDKKQKILIGDRSRKHNVRVEDIIYVEAYGDYIKVATSDGTIIVAKNTVKNFETSLSNTDFIRIHRSYLVNKSHITEVLTESVKIGCKEFPVSRANRKEVKAKFKKI